MSYDPPSWADKKSYDAGFDDGEARQLDRIRRELERPCGADWGREDMPHAPKRACELPKGHIGWHWQHDRWDHRDDVLSITVSRERLEEVLNG